MHEAITHTSYQNLCKIWNELWAVLFNISIMIRLLHVLIMQTKFLEFEWREIAFFAANKHMISTCINFSWSKYQTGQFVFFSKFEKLWNTVLSANSFITTRWNDPFTSNKFSTYFYLFLDMPHRIKIGTW